MKRFSNILMVADVDTGSTTGLNRAVALAKNNQASLTVCALVDAIPGELLMSITAVTSAECMDIAVSETREKLKALVDGADTQDVPVETDVLVGKPFVEIIRRTLRKDHDLIVKCVERTSNYAVSLFGSTDQSLLRKCPCPVWLIKNTDPVRYAKVLAAVDRDAEDLARDALNQPILEMASSLALAESSELHVVHAWDFYAEKFFRGPRSALSIHEVDAIIDEEEEVHRKWLCQLVDEHATIVEQDAVDYLTPQLHLIKGNARELVPKIAGTLEVDLIVMGTVGRTGIPGFLIGNTAETILNQIDCSVLAIKPPGFESPVRLTD